MQIPLGKLRETLLAQAEAYGNAARDMPGAAKATVRETKASKL